jgi:hypothetical protein
MMKSELEQGGVIQMQIDEQSPSLEESPKKPYEKPLAAFVAIRPEERLMGCDKGQGQCVPRFATS